MSREDLHLGRLRLCAVALLYLFEGRPEFVEQTRHDLLDKAANNCRRETRLPYPGWINQEQSVIYRRVIMHKTTGVVQSAELRAVVTHRIVI